MHLPLVQDVACDIAFDLILTVTTGCAKIDAREDGGGIARKSIELFVTRRVSSDKSDKLSARGSGQ